LAEQKRGKEKKVLLHLTSTKLEARTMNDDCIIPRSLYSFSALSLSYAPTFRKKNEKFLSIALNKLSLSHSLALYNKRAMPVERWGWNFE
jgi:hypothetical protein